MTTLILRLFIKNYQDVSNPQVHVRYGKLAGLVGIATNFLLFLSKLLIGIFFHSVSILADAVNNLMDFASSIITMVGFKLSEKPADEEHPFGHARMEYISGLIISFIIAILGFQLAQTSIEKILAPEESAFGLLTILILIGAICVKLWQGLFYHKLGKAIDSPTLEAAATDSRGDVVATGAVLLGTVITALTGFNLDGYMGLAVAVYLIVSGIRLLISTADPLLGMAPSRELTQKITEKILSYDGIIGMHDLMVHSYGAGQCFACVHCEVPASEDIMVSHDIVDNIEHDFKREFNIQLVIHMDPIVTDDAVTNALREMTKDIVRGISDAITVHDFRVVKGPTHSNLIFDIAVPFSYHCDENTLAEEISKRVQAKDPSLRTVITVDRVPASGAI